MPPDGEATQLSLDFLNFLSVARHRIVTRNAGARITYLVQYLVNQSREPGLERIRTLTKFHAYSITSSAATSSLSGTVRPSILAVW